MGGRDIRATFRTCKGGAMVRKSESNVRRKQTRDSCQTSLGFSVLLLKSKREREREGDDGSPHLPTA